MPTLQDKIALVTGAASGMGRATAIALASEGADVILSDINVAGLDQTRQAILAAAPSRRITQCVLDVGDSAAVNDAARTVHAEMGALDVLVHCAGITGPGKLVVDLLDDEWHRTVQNNLYSGFYLARAFAPPMLERRRGTMAYVASDNALFGRAKSAPYSSSKGGLISLVRTLALEFGPYNVTINAVNPGATNTPLTNGMTAESRKQKESADPLGRFSEPEDIAQIMLFLAGVGGSFMTGQLITTRSIIRP